MSKVKIQGNASGTGVLTITAPNTSTDRTITLPDTTGTLLDENSSVPAANLTGTVADARFPATLPAASAANLTAIPAANITGTLPAISGANLTGISAGKVLQVVQSTSTTYTHPGTAYDDITSSSITITPSATSSKILYIYNTGGFVGGNISNCYMRLERGNTTVREHNRWGYRNTSNYAPFPIHFMYLDSPNTTNSVTYKLQAKEQNAGSWEINDSSVTNGAVVIAMEIEG